MLSDRWENADVGFSEKIPGSNTYPSVVQAPGGTAVMSGLIIRHIYHFGGSQVTFQKIAKNLFSFLFSLSLDEISG